MSEVEVHPPGSVIGILGDGQLGRMIAIAAIPMGYRIAVLGPGGKDSPAGQVAQYAWSWGDDPENVDDATLDAFAGAVDVATIEWENVPINLISRLGARGVKVRPGKPVLKVCQDRLREKQRAERCHVPTAPYWQISDSREVTRVLEVDAFPGILKTRRDGYDGKGQVRVEKAADLASAWESLQCKPCILERVVDFKAEISVIVAMRSGDDRAIAYAPFENLHENGILRQSEYPSPVAVSLRADQAARWTALRLATELNVHVIRAVEYFVTKDGSLLMNEMAPRPHNSGHGTIEACMTSQFAQLVRAICNLPFGSVDFHSSFVMMNILGDEIKLWNDLAVHPGQVIHVYGKSDVRPGRKMGHVTRCRPLAPAEPIRVP